MRFILVLVLLAALAGPADRVAGPPALQAPARSTPLTNDETRQILALLAQAGETPARVDDDSLKAALFAFAREEFGLRVRPLAVDGLWGLEPPRRDPAAEFERARLSGMLGPWLATIARTDDASVALRAGRLTAEPTRAAQIEANLERLRWLPRDLPLDRLEINVATADATLYRQGRAALTMRIVVGDLRHKTPIFTSRIEAVILNPPWNVPSSIAAKEILPKAARDRGYLARNHYRFVDGRLQQRPGADNALGRLKFDLPSPYGVYLHDTPGKTAFQKTVRTLSHGCMRLEKPRELAVALLESQGWSPARLDDAIETGETQRIALQSPLPLFVTYQTAIVDEAGEVRFAPDVYGWDTKLAAALAGAVHPIAEAPVDTDCSEAPPGRP